MPLQDAKRGYGHAIGLVAGYADDEGMTAEECR
jgi:hypothetical protein